MSNYYEILGLDPTATPTQIRAAFKRMAMVYHPDRNPGNKQAEEIFKDVNEAYHTLSDPLKKSRHDAQFNPEPVADPDYVREVNKRKYSRWQMAQQKKYVIDKDYFRIQALAFLVFVVIAGFCFAILHTAQYFVEQKRMAHYEANTKILDEAGMLFSSGKFDDAFGVIHTLHEKDPLEYRINFMRDSLVTALRQIANSSFDAEDYGSAITNYKVLAKHEQPESFETTRQLSICQYYLGDYTESLQGMKRLLNQKPNSLDLVYSIGLINLEKLENPTEALYYFTYGKKLFKENVSKIYGAAFEMIMDPNDAPDIYYDMFIGRARANTSLNHFEDAITDCNWAIYLRQVEGEPYKLRAMANAGAMKAQSACQDIRMARTKGVGETEELERQYCR